MIAILNTLVVSYGVVLLILNVGVLFRVAGRARQDPEKMLLAVFSAAVVVVVAAVLAFSVSALHVSVSPNYHGIRVVSMHPFFAIGLRLAIYVALSVVFIVYYRWKLHELDQKKEVAERVEDALREIRRRKSGKAAR